MIWFFTRGSAQIDIEVRRISDPDGYELVVDYSDGEESVERFTNPRRLVERTLTLQRQLIGDGWMPSGPGMYGVRAKVRPRARVLRGPARLWGYVHRTVSARLAATFGL
ncbi:MAG TPA: hypothetical protein VL882_26710 [Vicinamibacterales bacterium]|jgi:hypothetical protein|nr:hypothetical protein [Vicinamibacterales bacterium]